MLSKYDNGFCSGCKRRHIQKGDEIQRWDGGWAIPRCIVIGRHSRAIEAKESHKEMQDKAKAAGLHLFDYLNKPQGKPESREKEPVETDLSWIGWEDFHD